MLPFLFFKSVVYPDSSVPDPVDFSTGSGSSILAIGSELIGPDLWLRKSIGFGSS